MSAGTSEFLCLICLLVCSCTAQKKITAKHGQDVILPCKVPNINNINDVTAAEWIRPGLDPEYILLYRDEQLDVSSQHPSYQNRVDLQDKEMKDGNFYLILKNVTMEDNGKYVCRVSQKGKTEPFSIITLKVYLSEPVVRTPACRAPSVFPPLDPPDTVFPSGPPPGFPPPGAGSTCHPSARFVPHSFLYHQCLPPLSLRRFPSLDPRPPPSSPAARDPPTIRHLHSAPFLEPTTAADPLDLSPGPTLHPLPNTPRTLIHHQ